MPAMKVRLLLLILGVLGGTAAAQQAKPDMAAAKQHYTAARAAVAAKDFDTAVKEYIAAYDITKDPSLFKQIAAAYEGGGQNDEAVVYYRRYLAEDTKATDSDDVKAKITALTPATQPDKPPPPPPPPPDDHADHTGKEPPPNGGNDNAPPPTFMDESPRWTRTAGWITVGVAAVALTTGSVLGTSALSRQEDLKRLTEFRDMNGEPKQYTGSVKADYEEKVKEGKNLNTYALVSFGVAGGFAVVATVFFIADAAGDKKHPAAEKATTWIIPTVSPNAAGVSAGVRF
jgi:hypothetical protein